MPIPKTSREIAEEIASRFNGDWKDTEDLIVRFIAEAEARGMAKAREEVRKAHPEGHCLEVIDDLLASLTPETKG